MSWRTRIGLLVITWVGAAVRLPGLFANTFHADEALFASWARLIAVGRDPLLQTVAVDKPPLLFYGQALFYPLFGPVEWAARMPNLIASILMIPLVGVVVWRVAGGRWQVWVAAGLVAFSPLAIQFSGTGFTDPLLVFWVVVGVWCVVDERPWAAGVVFGLALGTKYQGVLFLPLLVGVGWRGGWRRAEWLKGAAGLGVVLTAVLGWEIARTGTFTLWSAQMSSFGGVRLAWSWELWPRLREWLELLWYVVGWGWGLVVLGVGCQVSGVRCQVSGVRCQVRVTGVQRVVGVFVVGYLLVHWLLAIPVWDRYLLPLVPLVGIWVGSGVRWFPRVGRQSFIHYSLFIIHFLLLFSAVQAAHGRYPIGSTARSDQGAAAIAEVLIDAPYGTVLYDHWYSWHWRYHFFDKGVYVSWFPNGEVLAEELEVFGPEQRFVALPRGEVARPIVRELAAAGFGLEVVAADGNIILYKFVDER